MEEQLKRVYLEGWEINLIHASDGNCTVYLDHPQRSMGIDVHNSSLADAWAIAYGKWLARTGRP